MNPKETNPEVEPGIGIQEWFKRTGETVFVNSPCVITEAKNLRIGGIYELHDITEPEVDITYKTVVGLPQRFLVPYNCG